MFNKLTKVSVVLMLVAGIMIGMARDSEAKMADDYYDSAQLWTYLKLNHKIYKGLSFMVMPGFRYEFARQPGDAADAWFAECFVGPGYTHKINNLAFGGHVWYYLMFVEGTNDKETYSHCIELVPFVSYTFANRFTVSYRMILHNIVYVQEEDNPGAKDFSDAGHSLTMRKLVGFKVKATDTFSVFINDEIFIGCVEEDGTKKAYFDKQGLYLNRLYVGGIYKLSDNFGLTVQYIMEAAFDPDNDMEWTRTRHYAQLTAAINVDFTNQK